jgi:hypothetical protein
MDLSGPGIDVKLKERKKERKVPSRETNPMLLSLTALESRIHSAFASGNSLTRIHDADNDDDDL